MITVRIPTDNNFNYEEYEQLFNKCSRFIKDDSKFKDIVENTYFFSFYDDEKFLGCIYYYMKDGKLFVNAFANRGHHQLNLECFRKSFEWFNCDIYAKTTHKTAILCLLRCGFKKLGRSIYIKEK